MSALVSVGIEPRLFDTTIGEHRSQESDREPPGSYIPVA